MNEKPTALYHASSARGVREFEPRAEKTRDLSEGPVVFATPDKAYASMFLVPTDDSWTMKGRISSNGVAEPWHIVISDRERFEALDKGGVIYSFDPAQFATDPDRNMPGTEWTSKTSVVPMGNEEYASALSAMQQLRVQVLFTDLATFQDMRTADDHGRSLIHALISSIEV